MYTCGACIIADRYCCCCVVSYNDAGTYQCVLSYKCGYGLTADAVPWVGDHSHKSLSGPFSAPGRQVIGTSFLPPCDFMRHQTTRLACCQQSDMILNKLNLRCNVPC